jgi:hypothetical protein
VIVDLLKAARQSQFPEIRRPQRTIRIAESVGEIGAYARSLDPNGPIACDVETRKGQITCIGFSQSREFALVVPFIKGHKAHYWETPEIEAEALAAVAAILRHPAPKLFQNGLYDLQYIWRVWHLHVTNPLHDTMLRHHAQYPELQKGLGFLGSVYTDEPAWKLMRAKAKTDTEFKRDDE